MSKADRERWDKRYANPIKGLKRRGPNALLVRHVPPARPGMRALELACGLGANALWLAEQGYRVDAIDVSLEALRWAQAQKVRRGLDGVSFIVADLDHFPLPSYAYDLVYVFRFLDRRLFSTIRARVRPGGMVIYETFNIRHRDNATFAADHMLQLGELPGHFPGWTVLETGDHGPVGQFVGRKPAEG